MAGSSRRRAFAPLAGVILVALIGLGAVVAVFGTRDGDDDVPATRLPSATATTDRPRRSTTSTSAATTMPARPPDADLASLLSLMREGLEVDSHVRLVGSGLADGATLALEIWRRDGEVRQTETVDDGTGPVRSTLYVLDGRNVRCVQEGDEPPSCAEADVDPDAASTAQARVLFDLEQVVGDKRVVRSRATIAGEAAECFAIVDGDPVTGVCLTLDGVLVRVDAGAVVFEATSVERDVDPAALVPPDPP